MKFLLFLFSVEAFNLLVTINGCTINGQLRLVDGSAPYEGRVEVCINDQWGTVCDSFWGSNDNAQVVCRQLGYTTAGAQYKLDAYYGKGNGSVLLDGVRCYGYERSLLECSHYPNTSCHHSDDVGVQCTPYRVSYNCTTGSLRLVDGSNYHEGRVEVCVNGIWGTVCHHYWDSNDAQVACYQLGYSKYGAIAYNYGHFRSGDGSIFLDNVQCLGTESNILDCNHNVIGVHDCSDRKDAGIACMVKTNCTIGSLRLIVEPNTHKGRVEICMGGIWGSICSSDWDNDDASVACYQLGYSKYGAVGYTSPSESNSASTIVLSSVQCNGNELNLLNCSHTKGDYCYGGEAKVHCTVKTNCTIGSLRLIAEPNTHKGRVEICMGGIWGSICGDYYWDNDDASVACYQLGYSKYGAVGYHSPFSASSIVLSSVQCNWSELNLLNCSHTKRDYCYHGEAKVNCTVKGHSNCTSGSIRLVDGSSDDEGHIEICLDGIWGYICGYSWVYFNAKVACRQLGYSITDYGGADSFRNYYSGVKSPIIFSSLNCSGDESSLLDCSHGSINNCSNDMYLAGVRCQNVFLTPPQKAGIISGSVILFIILCCMCIVTACLWKRRKYRKYSSHLQQQNTSSLNCDDSDIELKRDVKEQASSETSKSNGNGLQDIVDK